MTPIELADKIEVLIPDEGSRHWDTWGTATMKFLKGDRELIAAALRASQSEAVERDAARYRWLRENRHTFSRGLILDTASGIDMDLAIDALADLNDAARSRSVRDGDGE